MGGRWGGEGRVLKTLRRGCGKRGRGETGGKVGGGGAANLYKELQALLRGTGWSNNSHGMVPSQDLRRCSLHFKGVREDGGGGGGKGEVRREET